MSRNTLGRWGTDIGALPGRRTNRQRNLRKYGRLRELQVIQAWMKHKEHMQEIYIFLKCSTLVVVKKIPGIQHYDTQESNGNSRAPCSPGLRRELPPLLWSPPFHYMNEELASYLSVLAGFTSLSPSPPVHTASKPLSLWDHYDHLIICFIYVYFYLLKQSRNPKSLGPNLHTTLHFFLTIFPYHSQLS